MNCKLCADKRPKQIFNLEHRDYHLCSRCGLLFMDPSYYFGVSESRSRYLLHKNDQDSEGYVGFLSQLAEPCLKYAEKDFNCLDYGCGHTKVMANIFLRHGFSMDSYDPIFYPDIKRRKYDFITCNEVIEHFYEPQEEFEKIYDLLSKGAVLGLGCSLMGPDTKLDGWYYIKDPTHVSFYSFKTIAYIAQKFSLQVLDTPSNRVIILKKL